MDDATTTAPTKPTQINIRLPQHMGDQIQEIARRERNSTASVCRRLLSASLDRETKVTEPEPR